MQRVHLIHSPLPLPFQGCFQYKTLSSYFTLSFKQQTDVIFAGPGNNLVLWYMKAVQLTGGVMTLELSPFCPQSPIFFIRILRKM